MEAKFRRRVHSFCVALTTNFFRLFFFSHRYENILYLYKVKYFILSYQHLHVMLLGVSKNEVNVFIKLKNNFSIYIFI